MSDQIRKYIIDYRTKGDGAKTTVELKNAMVGLNLEIDSARQGFKGLAADLKSIGSPAAIAKLTTAFAQLYGNANLAGVAVADVKASVAGMAGQATNVAQLRAAMQQFQRTAYGAKMNTKELGDELTRLASKGEGVRGLKDELGGLGTGLRGSAVAGEGLGLSLGSLAGAIGGMAAIRTVAHGIGDALNDARDKAVEFATESIHLRDSLRELANLKGKPGADDQVVADHLNLRVASGMDAGEARKFQEQFLGSLPLAKDKGGITDAIATPLSEKVAALAVRTGLDGGTAGDLAGVLGSFGKVGSVQSGLGQVQTIVDQLNDGRGNLTPLTKELMKNAAGTVGQGKAFATLQERAAAVSTSTGLGSVGQSSTRIDQAIRALGGFDKDQGETLKKYKIGATDDFTTRIEKIAPLVEGAIAKGESPDEALSHAGFGNATDRRSILGFVANRAVLRKRTDAVTESFTDPNGKVNAAGARAETLNQAFLGNDKAARNRVAQAQLDAARNERGQAGEDLEIKRKEAEARLLNKGKIDTPASNIGDKGNDLFGVLPALGFPSARQQRIDEEAGKGPAFKPADALADGIFPFRRLLPRFFGGTGGGAAPPAPPPGGAAPPARPPAAAPGQDLGGKLDKLIAVGQEGNRQRAAANAAPLPGPRDAQPMR